MRISGTFAILCCLMLIAVLGCGDSEAEKKEQALNAARSWAEDTTENSKLVIAEIVTLVTSDIPGASLFSGVIADQIAGLLSWEYSEPVNTTGDFYELTATVSTQATLDLPLIGSKTYEAKLPFDLTVDLGTGTVTDWSADFDSAKVGETETGS